MAWYHRWKVVDGSAADSTHLLLTGGKLKVSDASHAEFLAEYANSVARGERTSIVERRTPVFRLFFDLDIHDPHPGADDLLRGAMLAICALARTWFVSGGHHATVLRKDVDSPDKLGVHLVVEDVFVTSGTAVAFRDHVVEQLRQVVPDAPWDEIVDPAVFKGSGLRLPWAPKKTSPAVYLPAAEIRGEDIIKIEPPTTAADIRHWIRRLSIRAPDENATPVAKEYAAAACGVSTDSGSSEPTTSLQLRDYETVLTPEHLRIPAAYEPQKITSIHRVGESVVVLRSSSKKCANKGYEEHRSSNVYFVILRRGVMYQRCYCRKTQSDDRATDLPCSEFASPSWPVSKDLIGRLFPDNFLPDAAVVLPSKKKSSSTGLDALLSRTRPALKKKGLKGTNGAPKR